MTDKMRIAILGGGMSALTAALELSDPAQGGRYDITIYQMGWRLGGKGASGRNRKQADRIEEHGLHIWCGFYQNAFSLMRRCYTELDRAPDAPLSSVDTAFTPQNVVVYPQQIDGQWYMWELDFPTNALKPGDEYSKPFDVWALITDAVQWMITFYKGWEDNPAGALFTTSASDGHHTGLVAAALTKLGLHHHKTEEHRHVGLLTMLHDMLTAQPSGKHHPAMIKVLKTTAEAIWLAIRDDVDDDLNLYRHWQIVYLGMVVIAGLLADDALSAEGLHQLDQYDFYEWLDAHKLLDSPKANAIALKGSVLPEAIYNIAFAYEGGQADAPNFSAFVAVSLAMRIVLGYKGSVLYKMDAGMGDTIFAPIYTVLKRRGVRFEFFHEVTDVVPGEGYIKEVQLARQVDLSVGEYDPLILVKGLPCWPSEPLYYQLDPQQAARLQADEIDLERYNTGWQNVGEVTLKAGRDFDRVILGIPVAAHKIICKEIIATNPAWAQMANGVQTVQTQAVQLWMQPDLEQLGWKLPSALLGTYTQPYSTVGDYSHLIPRENWPTEANLHNITYVCDVLPDAPHETQTEADAYVKQTAIDWLQDSARPLWPNAASDAGLDWDVLVAPPETQGVARFDAQYWRANIDPSSRYTLCVKGSARHRLKTDATGYSNLYITGTWIDNGFLMGCIEGAVMSGMLTAQAISGLPATVASM